jgi:hypothetical protein
MSNATPEATAEPEEEIALTMQHTSAASPSSSRAMLCAVTPSLPLSSLLLRFRRLYPPFQQVLDVLR